MSTGAGMPGEPRADTAVDALFSALARPARRLVLYELTINDGSVALDELVEGLSAWDADGTPTTRHRARVELLHTHLPRMVEADLVAFERDRGTVTLTDRGREAEAVRQFIE